MAVQQLSRIALLSQPTEYVLYVMVIKVNNRVPIGLIGHGDNNHNVKQYDENPEIKKESPDVV